MGIRNWGIGHWERFGAMREPPIPNSYYPIPIAAYAVSLGAMMRVYSTEAKMPPTIGPTQ